MSPYLAGGMLLAFVAWSGFMYYEGGSKETAVCKAADGVHDLAQANQTVTAEKGVIATVGQQQTVTSGVSNAYEAKKSDIDSQYAAALGVQPAVLATGNSVGAVSNPASRPDATASRPFRSKVYGLSGHECDDNTAKLYGLQDWVRGQMAIKVPEGQ